jgi:hypothetical protein
VFTLPGPAWGRKCQVELDTAILVGEPDRRRTFRAGHTVDVAARSVKVLKYV